MNARQEIFSAYLTDAENAFRRNPEAAYRHLKELWKENMEAYGGKPGPMGPELEAYDTAASDFRSGTL